MNMTSGCTSISDMDLDITECLQNCPELDKLSATWSGKPLRAEQVPLLDASVLDQLCLSDDLWANLDAADVNGDGTCAVGGDPEDATGQSLQTFFPEEILGFATPPDSPPDSTLSYSNPASSISGSSCSQPQQPILHNIQTETAKHWLQQYSHTHTCGSSQSPGVASEATQTPAQSLAQGRDAVREKQGECINGLQQSYSQDGSVTVVPPATDSIVQVLKSGEVVCLSLSQQPQGGIENHSQDMTTLKTEGLCVGQKRPHPDSSIPDSKLSRKQQRMIKNREAASLSRQKKKEYVQTMEARLKEAAVKNTALLKENNLLRNQIVTLENENHFLRSGISRPSTPLGSLTTKPAVVMMVVLIFTFSFFFFPRHMIPSPFAGRNLPSTALSVPVHSQHGRALLSYVPVEELVASHEKALVPVYNELSPPLRTVENQKQGSLAHTHGSSSNVISTVCSCPVEDSSGLNASEVRNATVMKRMNGEVSQCFKWHERHFLQWQRELQQTKTSLAIVNTEFSIDGSFPYQVDDIARLYPYIKKSFTRDLYSYYLISFKDHILLDAPSHNSSEPPILSLIIPSDAPSPPGYLPMLQIDCEVLDTTLFHVELPQS